MPRTAILATLVSGLVTFGASVAHADQCQIVEADQAAFALKLAPKGASVIDYCEKCSPPPGKAAVAPSAPIAITDIAANAKYGKTEVSINGKSVDLAYTYLQTGPSTWTNLAFLVGCQTTGVRPTLALGTAKVVSPPHAPPPSSPSVKLEVNQLLKELSALAPQVTAAVEAVKAATSEADRNAAKARLDALKLRQREIWARMDVLVPKPKMPTK